MSKLKKRLIWFVGSLVGIVLIFLFVLWPIMKKQTKKHSPEQHITHTQGDLELKAFYSSPSKKGRVIFGELVPYGEVWRTGANEPTTITTNKDLMIDGQELKAGTYSLWTIPGEETWQVFFNSKMYNWGVKITDQKAARNPDYDVVTVESKVVPNITVIESLTISFAETVDENIVMMLGWDKVVIPVKMDIK